LPPLSEIRELSLIDRELQFEEAIGEGSAEEGEASVEADGEISGTEAAVLDDGEAQVAAGDSAVGALVDDFIERDEGREAQPQILDNENSESSVINNEENPEL